MSHVLVETLRGSLYVSYENLDDGPPESVREYEGMHSDCEMDKRLMDYFVSQFWRTCKTKIIGELMGKKKGMNEQKWRERM